jgi:tetratricopeptide (TPR) repeat protein
MTKIVGAFFTLIICFSVVASDVLKADEQLSREKLVDALVSGDLGFLDRTLNGLQQDFERNRHPDEELGKTFARMGNLQLMIDPAIASKRLDDWVSKFPRSYAAKTIRGNYLADMATQARGGKFADDTTDKQFAEMRKWNDLAKHDLLASLELTRYPLISHIHLFRIAMTESDGNAERIHFAKAFKISPKSLALHKQVLASLKPRWGGSYEAMQAYINKVGRELDSDKDRNILKSMIIDDKALYLTDSKEYGKAYALYDEAIKLRDSSKHLCLRAYVGFKMKKPATLILNDMKAAVTKDMPDPYCATMAANFAKANIALSDTIPLIDSYLKHFPRSAELYNARGWVYQEKGNKAPAYQDFLKSAELGDAWGQTMAGKCLFNGWGIPADRIKSLDLLKAAAEQGEPNAQLSVVQALEFLGKPEEAKLAKQRYATMGRR